MMMVHLHVLRSAAWSNLNISTSGLMQSSLTPPTPPRCGREAWSVFSLLFTAPSLSPISPWCVGATGQGQNKRGKKHFYVISIAVFWLLVWSQWQAAPQFSFPRGTFVGSPHHPVPFPRQCAVWPPETPLTTTPLTHQPHSLSLLCAPHL